MRVSKAQAEENRNRIVATAAHLFREKGFDGIGVADLMKAAGLTHGGFYGHFASKEDLAAQATAKALADSRRYWQGLVAADPARGFARIVQNYLSAAHRDRPGKGCALAALGSEAGRHAPGVQAAMTEGLKGLLAELAEVAPGQTPQAREELALAAFTQMVGALVLARAVDDSALAQRILGTVAEGLTGLTPPPAASASRSASPTAHA